MRPAGLPVLDGPCSSSRRKSVSSADLLKSIEVEMMKGSFKLGPVRWINENCWAKFPANCVD